MKNKVMNNQAIRTNMNNKKAIKTKTIAALLILAMLPTGVFGAVASDNTFKDVEKHWGKTYINRLYKEGFVKGSNGKFNPEEVLKTEDFLIMVLKVIKPEYKDLVATEGQTYYAPFIEKAVEIGLVKSDANFDEVQQYIERSMPRELAVQVVDRALTLMGETVTVDHGLEYKFKDFKIVNDINKEAVLKAFQLGIIKGSNGQFKPKSLLTRAEATVLVTKVMDKTTRDKMIFANNPKVYDKVVEWFLKSFEKQVQKRTVIIEKKTNGFINNGDVDFTEKAFSYKGKSLNWWTDKQFEDNVLDQVNLSKEVSSSQLVTGVSEMMSSAELDLKRIGGSFVPHDGEITFVNVDDVQSGKATKHYELPTRNINRMVYDISKYGTQYATLDQSYFRLFSTTNHISLFVAETFNINTIQGDITFYKYPKEFAKYADMKFSPDLSFSVNTYFNLTRNEALFRQSFSRIYGADGDAIFNNVKTWMKGRTKTMPDADITKTYKGITIRYIDSQYTGLTVFMTLKK